MIKSFKTIIALVLMLALSASCDMAKKEAYVIGIVSPTARLGEVIEGFKKGMRDYGYIEGQSIIYIYNGPVSDPNRMEKEIKGLIDKGVNMLFTVALPPTLKAKRLTSHNRIPVVFAPMYDPVRSGVVNEIGMHECNMTGVQTGGNAAKALYWLKELSPEVNRIVVPYDTKASTTDLCLSDLREGAENLGVTLEAIKVSSRSELANALKTASGSVDAIWLLNSYFLVDNIDLFTIASLDQKIPLASGTSQRQNGVTVSYGQNLNKTGEIASSLAHKIIKGARPSDLPIETTDFFLGINLQMANKIGLDIADHILQQADFIER